MSGERVLDHGDRRGAAGRRIDDAAGFLHGFCTIAPDTEVIYKVTADYDKAAERAVIWNDPTLAIPWPIAPEAAHLSDKDRAAPPLDPAETWFSYR